MRDLNCVNLNFIRNVGCCCECVRRGGITTMASRHSSARLCDVDTTTLTILCLCRLCGHFMCGRFFSFFLTRKRRINIFVGFTFISYNFINKSGFQVFSPWDLYTNNVHINFNVTSPIWLFISVCHTNKMMLMIIQSELTVPKIFLI